MSSQGLGPENLAEDPEEPAPRGITGFIKTLTALCATLVEQIKHPSFAAKHRERLVARRQSAVLLELFHAVQARNPELSGVKLYEKIVVDCLRCEEQVARKVVLRAEESYARWPVSRQVTFRDVVNHLNVTQIIAAKGGVVDTHPNMDEIVASIIPANW